MPRERPQQNVCAEWREWEHNPTGHAPFHYWRWDAEQVPRSTQRVGQRMYMIVCLLWSALHDRVVGRSLSENHPNWSAIASYYSMVHSLRLTWFVIYGGYPKSHAPMGRAMSGGGPVAASWSHGVFEGGRSLITGQALAGALREGLARPDLADRLPAIGKLFGAAVDLRNDANYESLVLAHQYYHGGVSADPDPVDVSEQAQASVTALREAQDLIHSFTSAVLSASFSDGPDWYCPAGAFSGGDLRSLVVLHVDQLIARSGGRVLGLREMPWWPAAFDSFRLNVLPDGPASRLETHFAFDDFQVKRAIMQEFRSNVQRLNACVEEVVA